LSAVIGRTPLAERLAGVRQRIDAAARRSGRAAGSVRLVAVSKFRTTEEIEEAIAAGVTELGESRVQEAETKLGRIAAANLVWHLVGRLQSNKAKKAVQYFDIIHSISTLEMARRVDRLAGEQHKTQDVLVQVQVADEESKQGLPVSELYPTLERMAELTHLRVLGLMALPPYLPNPEDVRPYFVRLRELRDAARSRGLGGPSFSELSMGMSHDFDVAVEEGATIVRVGTAIFGERPAGP
jgi:pyridoxal phosphate enzyme (YggS family)